MKHDINQLIERQQYNRDHNISFDSESLIAEATEDLALFAPNTHVMVWCDPEDNFIKDYHLIDLELVDDDEKLAAENDKASFVRNKQHDDIYMISLGELLDLLNQQQEAL